MSAMTPEEVRSRMVEIDDESRELAADEFARRFALATEADELRALLTQMNAPAIAKARKGWAGRAGRKGAHEVNEEAVQSLVKAPGQSSGR